MSNLNIASEQFGDFSKSAVDAAMKFAHVSFESAERMIALNLEAAKAGLDVTAKNAKSLAAVKDVQELNTVRTKGAETGLEFMLGYSRTFYELSTAAQAQFSALAEERFATMQKSVAENLDTVSKSAPAGSDVAIAALKSSMAASTAAFDSVSKAAKQFTAFADNAVKVAADTATKTTTKAASAGKRK
ncbi:MAG: phasin family protein [Betaproteobacteria bacterium]|nr:phasin family protein [Betaproteobacteria bacterium]